jgi:DNA-binding GntR family transcriptional regulator
MSRERAPPGPSGRLWRKNRCASPSRMVSSTATAASGRPRPFGDSVASASGSSMAPAIHPLPDQSLADAVADWLRKAIHNGEFSPGQRLVERALSDLLGVSHIPVREALTKLEDEGLVVRRPRRGARVAQLSSASIAEISSMRVLLEGFVVRRVSERWTKRMERDLLRLADQMVAAARKGDAATVIELDTAFHEGLCGHADHSILLEVTTAMRGRISSFLCETIRTLAPDELVAYAVTHRTLTQVIATGDAEAAAAAVRAHIQASADRIEEDHSSGR